MSSVSRISGFAIDPELSKQLMCLLVEGFVRSTARGQGGHLIRSVRLQIRTGFRRDGMFLISSNGAGALVCKTLGVGASLVQDSKRHPCLPR